jgi:type IV pilus assembly protein PilB
MGSAQATSSASKTSQKTTTQLFGELLVSKGLVDSKELVKVLNEQRERGGRLGEVLLRLKMLNDKEVTAALAEHFSMEYIRFDDPSKTDMINIDIARMLPESIAKRFCLAAIGEMDDKIVVVMADPLNVIALDTVTLKLRRTDLSRLRC